MGPYATHGINLDHQLMYGGSNPMNAEGTEAVGNMEARQPMPQPPSPSPMEPVTINGGAGEIPNPTPASPHAGEMQRMGGVIAPTIDPKPYQQHTILDVGTGEVAKGSGYYDSMYSLSRMKQTANPTAYGQSHQDEWHGRQMHESLINGHYTPINRVGLMGSKGVDYPHQDFPAGQATNPQFGIPASQYASTGKDLINQAHANFAQSSHTAISPGQIVPEGQSNSDFAYHTSPGNTYDPSHTTTIRPSGAAGGQFHVSDLDDKQVAAVQGTLDAEGYNGNIAPQSSQPSFAPHQGKVRVPHQK